MVSPVRIERTTLAFGGQRSVPLSYGEVAPGARFKLTTGASHAPVLFATPPGSVAVTASDAYGTRTRRPSDRQSDALPAELTRQREIDSPVGLAGIEPTASAPRTPRATSLRHSPLSAAREGGDDPPPPGSEPGVLPVTPLPNGASPEDRTPICGVRARPVTSYRRDAEVGGKPGPLEVSVGD